MLFWFLVGGLFVNWLVHKFKVVRIRFDQQENRFKTQEKLIKQIEEHENGGRKTPKKNKS